MIERLLVVGGTGFIGRNLVLCAMDFGFEIVVLSLHKPSKDRMVDGVEYIQLDLIHSNLKSELPTDSFDYVVNLSGYIDHSEFLQGGREVIQAHFDGVLNLVQFLEGKKLKRFIQIGSSDEYGNNSAPQHEEMRELPISPYSFGKVASSQFLQMLYRTQDFPVVILRLFLVYGPGQDNKRFLPQIIQGCLSGNDFPTSAGEQLRDFCYVDDIVQGIMSALYNEKANGQIINLASGEPIRVRDVVISIRDKLGRGNPQFGEFPYRLRENMALYANISKAKEILGWRPTMTFDEGVDKIIDSYLSEKN